MVNIYATLPDRPNTGWFFYEVTGYRGKE